MSRHARAALAALTRALLLFFCLGARVPARRLPRWLRARYSYTNSATPAHGLEPRATGARMRATC
eukprot:8910692-Heterocapsa_arctica.AAC.1